MIPALYQYLTQHCQSVKTWYQYGLDLAGKALPYGIIEVRADQASLNNRRGAWEYVRLWVWFPRGSWLPVNAAIDEVQNLFLGVTLTRSTGGAFALEPVGALAGVFDDQLVAFGRAIDFRVPVVRSVI